MSKYPSILKLYQAKMILAETVDLKNESGVPRLRALPGQTITTLEGQTETVEPSLFIQSESKPREENPVGTIFEVYITEKHQSEGKVYYTGAGFKRLEVHRP